MGNLLSSFLGFSSLILSTLGPFLLLLAVLIFIHELGHFLVARWCGVKVEVFSLGFGPKLFQYKKGDTIYCISALPFGGYVKMFGDNPLKPVPKEEQHKGFLYKKVPQKLAIAFGGPAMNLLFTFGAFWFLLVYGLPAFSPVLGDVPADSKAWQKGLRAGDTVTAIEGKPVNDLEIVLETIRENPDKALQMDFLSSLGEKKTVSLTPKKTKNESPVELKKFVGQINGFTFASKGTRVGVSSGESPAFQAGLRTLDEITEINGQKVKYWRDLEPIISAQKDLLTFTVKRSGDSEKKAEKFLTFQIPLLGSLSPDLKSLGLELPDLYIRKVGKGTPAEKSGLKKGDKIVSIQGNQLNSWEEVSKTIKNYTEGTPLAFGVLRQGEIKEFFIQPKRMITDSMLKETFMVGVISGAFLVFPEEKLKQVSFLAGFIGAGGKTWYSLKAITANMVQLVTGRISYRSLSGPVGIGRVAHQSFQAGLLPFIFLMAWISAYLFYINLLPVPLLDGGHILFFSIEGLLGRSLDLKKLILAQQIGLMALLSLFAFAFVNDIYKWLTAW